MLPDTTDRGRHTVHSAEQYTINALFPAGDPGGLQRLRPMRRGRNNAGEGVNTARYQSAPHKQALQPLTVLFLSFFFFFF